MQKLRVFPPDVEWKRNVAKIARYRIGEKENSPGTYENTSILVNKTRGEFGRLLADGLDAVMAAAGEVVRAMIKRLPRSEAKVSLSWKCNDGARFRWHKASVEKNRKEGGY